jgi:Protein of unknown function (DUF3667)
MAALEPTDPVPDERTERCANCATPLLGTYCHACGQRRLERLTLREFLEDVLRRVFRFDKALAQTFWRMLKGPGALAADYLEGRRRGILDPLHFFISSVFIQFMIAALTRAAAPLVDRTSALAWVERIGGIVAVKILIIFWMASIWRLLFRAVRYNLAEVYVFATYVYATIGLLWALVPLVDLVVPVPLGVNDLAVTSATMAIEVAYVSYAVRGFARLPLWLSVLRVTVVLAIGYTLLGLLIGAEDVLKLLLPPMPAGELDAPA